MVYEEKVYLAMVLKSGKYEGIEQHLVRIFTIKSYHGRWQKVKREYAKKIA